MKKEELRKMADSFQKKADVAYENYQQTGIGRYGSAYRRNEEMADVIRMAANAAEDHEALLWMRAEMSNFASRAARATSQTCSDSEKVELAAALARDVAAYGRMHGLIGKEQ